LQFVFVNATTKEIKVDATCVCDTPIIEALVFYVEINI
jgi:hypothetical protein